jgi:hypothetical protein
VVFLDHTQRRTTFGRTPLDERSARRRDLYLIIHNRKTSMLPAGFEPTISTGQALDRAVNGTGLPVYTSMFLLTSGLETCLWSSQNLFMSYLTEDTHTKP